jgi:hypothetical protein
MLKKRKPLTDTNLLFAVTMCIFIAMYVFSIFVFGGGFTAPPKTLTPR